jgi:hypothetical protein
MIVSIAAQADTTPVTANAPGSSSAVTWCWRRPVNAPSPRPTSVVRIRR